MPRLSESEFADSRGIWVLAEISNETLHPVSAELLGKARELATSRPQRVTAVAMGSLSDENFNALAVAGADDIISVTLPHPEHFKEEERAAVLARLIGQYRPAVVLAGATIQGRSLLPRVAAIVDCGLTADCTGLEFDPQTGALLQTRPAFGGSLMATIRSDEFMPQMATVRPGVMRSIQTTPLHRPRLLSESLLNSEKCDRKSIIELMPDASSSQDFSSAEMIVAGGRGMQGPEGFALLHRFAEAIGGAVGATRAAVDSGWAPYAMQIGQTGRTVQPRIYIACGISGQIQHLVGMQSSDKIIAINTDQTAPIFAVSDVAVIGDVFTVLPSLIAKIKQKRG